MAVCTQATTALLRVSLPRHRASSRRAVDGQSPQLRLDHLTREVTIGGKRLRAGDMVAVMLSSANRDDTAFEHPDALDLTRRNNPHLAFGLGVHRCIGSNLARLEVTSAIDALLAKVRNVGLVPGTVLERTPSASELSWQAVPVRFDLVPGAQL